MGYNSTPVHDFERFEGELHQIVAAAEGAVLAHELEQHDVNRPAVTIAGQRHHRVLRLPATYISAAGPITVVRTLYRIGHEPAVVPLELRAGIIEGHWTPRAAHPNVSTQRCRVVCKCTRAD